VNLCKSCLQHQSEPFRSKEPWVQAGRQFVSLSI
jgi:hypothetical protein